MKLVFILLYFFNFNLADAADQDGKPLAIENEQLAESELVVQDKEFYKSLPPGAWEEIQDEIIRNIGFKSYNDIFGGEAEVVQDKEFYKSLPPGAWEEIQDEIIRNIGFKSYNDIFGGEDEYRENPKQKEVKE